MGRALRCDLGETPVSCTKTATNSNQLLSFAFRRRLHSVVSSSRNRGGFFLFDVGTRL